MNAAPRWPWLTLGLAAAALCVAVLPGAQRLLACERAAVAAGEWWRLGSGHFVHVNASHLLWDVAAFAGLGAACELRGRRRTGVCLLAAALLVPSAVLLLQPSLTSYCGLSGLDSMLFALLLTDVGRQARRDGRPRLAAAVALCGLGFVAKLAFEFATSATVFAATDGFLPVPLAHAVGAAVGATAVGIAAVRGLRPGSRRRAVGRTRRTAAAPG